MDSLKNWEDLAILTPCPEWQKLTVVEQRAAAPHLGRSLELPSRSPQSPPLSIASQYWGQASVAIYYYSGAIDLLSEEP